MASFCLDWLIIRELDLILRDWSWFWRRTIYLKDITTTRQAFGKFYIFFSYFVYFSGMNLKNLFVGHKKDFVYFWQRLETLNSTTCIQKNIFPWKYKGLTVWFSFQKFKDVFICCPSKIQRNVSLDSQVSYKNTKK